MGKQTETVEVGKYEIFFKRYYQILYMINDFLMAVIFFVGSIFFLYPSLKTAGCILFAIGSIMMAIRPTIRLVHNINYKKYRRSQNG